MQAGFEICKYIFSQSESVKIAALPLFQNLLSTLLAHLSRIALTKFFPHLEIWSTATSSRWTTPRIQNLGDFSLSYVPRKKFTLLYCPVYWHYLCAYCTQRWCSIFLSKYYMDIYFKWCRLSWLTNSALGYGPKCRERGELRGLRQWVQLGTRSNKLWRYKSIFNLWPYYREASGKGAELTKHIGSLYLVFKTLLFWTS